MFCGQFEEGPGIIILGRLTPPLHLGQLSHYKVIAGSDPTTKASTADRMGENRIYNSLLDRCLLPLLATDFKHVGEVNRHGANAESVCGYIRG